MNYRVIILPSALHEIDKLPPEVRRRVSRRIVSLGQDPRPHGVIKMQGEDAYRVRVGDYRVIYTIEDDVKIATVTRVGHRREVYH